MAKKRKSSPGPFLLHLELLRDQIPDINQYPFTLPAVRSLTTLPLHEHVTFLVGENGSGKSTLLEAIAIGCHLNPEGGSRNFNFSTHDSHSSLTKYLRLARRLSAPGDSYFLRAESFYNVASEIERLDKEPEGGPPIINAYGGTSLHHQSHGESFFALFKNRFRSNGLYLMHEPEAALSPARQLQFLALLHDYVKRGCQFVIATHSPIIMAYPQATIYVLDEDGIKKTDYAETAHYQITRGFLNSKEKSLSVLMQEDEEAT